MHSAEHESLELSDHVFWVWSYSSMRLRDDKHGVAGIFVHEALHQHGYAHDDCTNQTTYDKKQHSVPYIAQWCLRDTLNKSDSCKLSCAPPGRAIIINSDSDRDHCECVYERDYGALGAIGLDSRGKMEERFDLVVHGKPLDNLVRANDHPDVFRYTPESVLAIGQFDGRGGDDLLVRDSRTGDLLVLRRAGGAHQKVARWRAGQRRGQWLLWRTDVVLDKVGDFDGTDGREEFIMIDDWSIALVGLDANDNFRTLRMWYIGSNLGSSNRWGAWWDEVGRGLRVPAVALATAAAVAVVVMVARPTDEYHVKGVGIVVYRERGGEVETVANEARLRARDRLRFRVSVPKDGSFLIAGVEERGKPFPLYPADGVAMESSVSGNGMLPAASELDASTGRESILLVWCPRSFQLGDIAASAGGVHLPEGCLQRTLPIIKE